jgi:phosphatidylglycerophosphatase A
VQENTAENRIKFSVAEALATAGGVGYAPIAPGTFGSAVGVLIYLPLSSLSPFLYIATVAVALFLGIWAADVAEQSSGKKDDGRIVIDEVVGQLITLFPLLLLVESTSLHSPLLLLVGFLSFRLFDVWKPGPARWAERNLNGGMGVMFDDVIAGLFAALTLIPAAIYWGTP